MGRKQSPARRAKRAAVQAAVGGKEQPERALQAVPDPAPQPAAAEEAGPDGDLVLDMDLNFMMPPMDLLLSGAPVSRAKRIDLGAVEAHWQKFAMSNPDLKVFAKTVRALVRVLIREHEASVQKAREEMQRTGVPTMPEPGPLLRAVREERRMVQAEETGSIFDEDGADG